jgi:hypothetical protein
MWFTNPSYRYSNEGKWRILMSWWVTLEHEDGSILQVDLHMEGGTTVLGGTSDADLNITYNYGGRFREVWPEFDRSDVLKTALDGKQAGNTIEFLQRGVDRLGVDRSLDYWEPTNGNAGHALSILLGWAERYPDGIWRVS